MEIENLFDHTTYTFGTSYPQVTSTSSTIAARGEIFTPNDDQHHSPPTYFRHQHHPACNALEALDSSSRPFPQGGPPAAVQSYTP